MRVLPNVVARAETEPIGGAAIDPDQEQTHHVSL